MKKILFGILIALSCVSSFGQSLSIVANGPIAVTSQINETKVIITNTSGTDIKIQSILPTSPSNVIMTSNHCHSTIYNNSACWVGFKKINDEDNNLRTNFEVKNDLNQTVLSFDVDSLKSLSSSNPNPFAVSSTTISTNITLTNNSGFDLTIGSVEKTITSDVNITLFSNTCITTLAPGATCVLGFRRVTPVVNSPLYGYYVSYDIKNSDGKTLLNVIPHSGTIISSMTFNEINPQIMNINSSQTPYNFNILIKPYSSSLFATTSFTSVSTNDTRVTVSSHNCTNVSRSDECYITLSADVSSVGPISYRLTATYAGGSLVLNKVLTVINSASFSISGFNFGNMQIGINSSKVITIQNNGSSVMTIQNITSSNPLFNIQDASDCYKQLNANDTCSVILSVSPNVFGEMTSSITVNSVEYAPIVSQTSLSLIGVGPRIKVSPIIIPSNGQVSIKNISNSYSAVISDIVKDSNLKIISNTCVSYEIKPGITCKISFKPISQISNNQILIKYNNNLSQETVTLN